MDHLKEELYLLEITICDDDLIALDSIVQKIRQYAIKKKLFLHQHLYTSSENLMLALHDGEKSNLYILDVEMPIYNGLELAEEIHSINPGAKVIIASVYGKYGVDAVNADVARYILKGDPDEKLFAALDDVLDMLQWETGEILYFQRYSDVITINSSEVLYIIKDGKYCLFHMSDSCVKQVRSPIQEVFKALPEGQFLFTDKGIVANIRKISSIENDKVLLQGGGKIPVSRNRKRAVLEQIASFWTTVDSNLLA